VLQPDGKLTVTGMTRSTYGSGPWDIAVARYIAIRFCIVPKVRGKMLAAARRSLMKTLCRVGTVKRKYSAQVKKGRVISQRPAPGTRVAEFTKVSLVVSRGRERR
jgi:PASTA domain